MHNTPTRDEIRAKQRRLDELTREARKLTRVVAGSDPHATSRAQNAYHTAKNREARDLALNPAYTWEPKDLALREAWKADAQKFLRDVFPKAFCRPFCRDHVRLIEATQAVAMQGGQYARALWRGAGKTAIFARMMLWAILHAYHRFGLVVGAENKNSVKIAKDQQTELRLNPQLVAQYPEVCNPFREINGDGRLKGGQTWQGVKTEIDWSQQGLKFATIPPAVRWANAGGQIWARSIIAAARGLHDTLPDGTIVRPSFILLDDVQTDRTAKSLLSTLEREEIIDNAIMGLFAGDTPPCIVQACTPILDDDLACHYLNRNKSPAWRGETSALLLKPPTNDSFWDQYRAIQDEQRRIDGDLTLATKFYADHREPMDLGAVVSWLEGPTFGRLSVLQFCMDTKFERPAAFAAEYQCKPLTATRGADLMLSRDEIAGKVSALSQGVVPEKCDFVTAFVDAGKSYLFYAVCAWAKDFTGSCIEYGAWPPQKRLYFSKDDPHPSIADEIGRLRPTLAGANEATMLAAALDVFLPELAARTWQNLAGDTFPLKRILCDTGDQGDVVCAAIARLKQPQERLPIVMPSKGFGIGEGENEMAEWKKHPGDVIGWHWRAPEPKERAKLRAVNIDTNHFKSLIHKALFVDCLLAGSITLYGDQRTNHSMMADQLTAEMPDRRFSAKRQKWATVWIPKPNRENEGLDCIVGCAVGASMLGAELAGAGEPPRRSGRSRRPIGELLAGPP